MTDLTQALAELRRVTPKTGPESQWYGEDFNDDPTKLEGAVQHNAWWDAMALRALLAELEAKA